MREYRVPSTIDQRFVLCVESKTNKIFERDPDHRGCVRLVRVERITTRKLIPRAEANELIYGTPSLARWVPQERAKLIFPDGHRETRLVSVCKKIVVPEMPNSSGSARMSPPTMLRKRSNKLRGRGRATRNGDWRRSAYEALLDKEMSGDVLAVASLDGWKFIRFRRRNPETGEVLVDPNTGEALPEEFGTRWCEIDQKGRVIPAGVRERAMTAVSEGSILFFPNV